MKKRIVALGVAFILCLAANVALGAVLVNFDDKGFVSLDDVTTQYIGVGVVFQGFANQAQVNLEAAGNDLFTDNNPPSPPMSLSNFYNHNASQRADVMRILFTSPTGGIEFMYNGAGASGSSTMFDVYGMGGNLLDAFTVAAATDSNYHLVQVADSNVGWIDIVAPEAGWGHYIDNLAFQPSAVPAVPEPATMLLLGFGLLGLAGYGRKKFFKK